MAEWRPSAQYRKIAEANRQYYARTAQVYDSTETCVTDGVFQAGLEQDLDAVLALLGRPPAAIQALDACGGSGNITLKLLRRGVPTVTSDISADLLAICRSRCEAEGLTPRLVCTEIGDFLSAHPGQFDLIVFSSALHHLEDIDAVLDLAYASLRPDGVIFTTFDPAAHRHRYERLIFLLDYLTFKVHRQPGDLLASLSRRVRRTVRGATKTQADLSEENLGFLAEYHVERGIDDLALATRLRARGVEIVRHEREAGGRYAPTRALLRALGTAAHFKLVLRKPAA